MALRVRFSYTTGATLGYSIERMVDGLYYDFTALIYTATPTTQVQPLPEDTGNFVGRYKDTLTPTLQAQFPDGDYTVTIHDMAAANAVLAEMGVVMVGGDDATSSAGGGGGTGLDVYDRSVLVGRVAVDNLGNWTFYDPADAVTPRVKFTRVASPGGRSVTLDPT